MIAASKDIFTEPSNVDPHTSREFLAAAAARGFGAARKGDDVHPVADGSKTQAFVDRIEFSAHRSAKERPAIVHGLRYHQHIVKPGEVETFHDQVGYWLWEPATGMIIQTVAIPRGQIAMAIGKASPDAREFEVAAARGSTTNGIARIPSWKTPFARTNFVSR